MSMKEFFTGSGSLAFDERFVSVRIVKDALDRTFKLRILKESTTRIKCKIIRSFRLYGGPVWWPNATMDLVIKKEGRMTRVYYDFKWPEYYMVLISSTLVGIFAVTLSIDKPLMESVLDSGILFFLALSFFGLLVFLDTKYVASRIRRILFNL